jgi:archaemetzincin
MRTYAKYLSFAVMCIALQGDASSADVPKAAPAVAKTFASPDGRSTYTRTGVRRRVNATIAKLKPLHQKIRKAKPGKWLAEHKEAGQTFYQYLQSRPAAPIGRRTVIYVQPLGLFTKQQRQIVELAAEYLGIYMNRSVKILEDLPLSVVPQKARRIHPEWKMKQILSTYVLHSVLKPRLPKDAAAYIAFTATDLWPGRGWNFLFGQATFRDRVGVWSIYRNGDPSTNDAAFRLCLRRTLKIATHETGHMFSIPHCTAYECNMCGTNNLEESDSQPLYLGPECHAKITWATAADPVARYQRLAKFCQKHELKADQAYFNKAIKALK